MRGQSSAWKNRRFGEMKCTSEKSGLVKDSVQVKRERELVCFNCNEKGHGFQFCPKPRRGRGSCYGCGSRNHVKRDCPSISRPSGASGSGHPSSSTRPRTSDVTTMVVTSPTTTYVPVRLHFNKNDCDFVVNVRALLDTGSPISFIRLDCLPSFIMSPVLEATNYCGINGSELKVLGVYDRDVIIESLRIPIKFYVVPNETMFPNILGRNFTNL